MVDDWAGGELATALRRMVFASERYRLRVARALMGMGATEMIALGLLAVDGACTPTELAARLRLSTARSPGWLIGSRRPGWRNAGGTSPIGARWWSN
jgi:hypothetical protein